MRLRPVSPAIAALAVFGALAALSGCTVPETRQFEIRVDGGFYTVTEQSRGLPLPGREPLRTVRVSGRDIPCPELPCTAEIRAARAETGPAEDEFRLPPEGVDTGVE